MTTRFSMFLALISLVALMAAPAPAKDGRLYVAGANNSGQLGIGAAGTTVPVFTQVPGLRNVSHVAAGNLHSLVLCGDGTLWVAGQNHDGRLGLGNTTNQPAFVQVPGLTNVEAIAAGDVHSLALSGGTLYSTGYNYYGNLGLGDNSNRSSFQAVSGLSDVTMVRGQSQGSALLMSGLVSACGYNGEGELGLGDNDPRSFFTNKFQNWVVSIATGQNHLLALSHDGPVYASGRNTEGQLGLGDNTDYNYLASVDGLGSVSAIFAGARSSFVLMGDGAVKATGDNSSYQLGLGDLVNRNVFTTVPGLAGVTAIAPGMWHTLALKSDGTLWGAGKNLSGQLGLTKGTDITAFTRLAGVNSVFEISAGRDSLVAAWYGVELTTPTAADMAFEVGEKTTIRWNSFNLPKNAKVRIDLVKGGSETWTLSAAASNTGSFAWTVGAWKSKTQEVYPEGADYRIRITSPDGVDFDESAFDFGIGSVDSLKVTGNTVVDGGDSASYTCTAHFTSGAERDVTTLAKWSCSKVAGAKMGKTGLLTTASVTAPQPCTITATYGKGKLTGTLPISINP